MMPMEQDAPPPEIVETPAARWYQKFGAIAMAVICLEVGLFLGIFPWTEFWNYFLSAVPGWSVYWDHSYVQGAVSVLGMVNLYISLTEIGRLRRLGKS